MNELQLKQAIFEALKYADIYDSITVLSLWGLFIAFVVTGILLISKYVNFFENNMALDEPFIRHLDFMTKLSAGCLIAFGTLACVFPSKDSKISEAEAYISQLEDTPKNQLYIYSLSKKYDIQSSEDLRRQMEVETPIATVETAVEVTASEPVVEKTN